jgi:hypothetical protein
MAGDLEQAPRYPNLRAHPFNYPSRPSRSSLSVGELPSLGALSHPRKRQESLYLPARVAVVSLPSVVAVPPQMDLRKESISVLRGPRRCFSAVDLIRMLLLDLG